MLYCEALKIDENFVKEYNQSPRMNINSDDGTVVINGWYRNRLGGIHTKQDHDLEISEVNGFFGKFRASVGHPQIVVRLATWLGVISVALGFLGVCLSFK